MEATTAAMMTFGVVALLASWVVLLIESWKDDYASRIPVLKWFFGSRTAKMRKSKLTIFIRPTIIY